MHGNSKQEQVNAFIKRMTLRAMHEIAFDDPEVAAVLRKMNNRLLITVAYNVTDGYGWLELADLMEWKTRRVSK